MQSGSNVPLNGSSNPVWITVVILTAALMVIFLLFFGTRSAPVEVPGSAPQENTGQSEVKPAEKTDQTPVPK